MNSVGSIFVALSLLFGGGYALDKIYVYTKTAAVKHIQRGLPSLESFTNRLTCSRISASGNLVPARRSHLSTGKKVSNHEGK